jgi:hypothetical protein
VLLSRYVNLEILESLKQPPSGTARIQAHAFPSFVAHFLSVHIARMLASQTARERLQAQDLLAGRPGSIRDRSQEKGST